MAQQVKKCVSTELIDRNGNFNTDGMKKFEKDVKLAEQGRSYGVVSIMGPQSSGKSTLLNHLFGTDFKEMDARLGRFQTTKGVCLAHTPSTESFLLVLDTEGSDGAERKDNTTFERQTALLGIAVSEVVIINMWHHDVGRRNAASWPLLIVVFEVMLRVLTPRKVRLIFVVRDSVETPLEILKMQLINQLEEIWNEIPKPPAQTNTALRDRFEIAVVALSSYKYQKQQFEEEVATLRERVVRTLASSELTTNRTDASAFTLNTRMIWDQVRENKDLDLPSLKLMVAESRCSKIFQEKYQNFLEDPSWIKVKNNVHSGAVVQGFGKTVSRLINTYLCEYDKETQCFDEGVKAAKRKLLNEEMLQVVEPTYLSELEKKRNAVLNNFEETARQELKSSGKLTYTKPSKFIDELRNQHKDVAIKHAKWNHFTEELTKLELEVKRHIKWIQDVNGHLDHKKLARREFWFEVVKIGINVIVISSGVAASIASSTPAPVPLIVASSAGIVTGLKHLAAITEVLAKNQEKLKEV